MARFPVALLLFFAIVRSALATDLTILAQGTAAGALRPLISQFEKENGDTINVTFGNPGVTLDRIRKGDGTDVVIVVTLIVDTVVKEGLADPASRTPIATSRIGMAVAAGAPKPLFTNRASFTEAMHKLQTIGLVDPNGGSGTSPHFIKAVETAGLASEISPKYRFYQGTGEVVAEAIAKGEVEAGVTAVSELMPNKGVQVVGPIPTDVLDWSSTTYALVGSHAKAPAEARKFIEFLVSPVAKQAFTAIGLE